MGTTIVDFFHTERAKSISNKDGLNSNRSSYRASAIAAEDADSAASTPRRDESPSQSQLQQSQTIDRDVDLDDTMDRLTGGARTPSPLKENFTREDTESDFKRTSTVRASPSNAMPSRSGTVSWQQRPKSRAGRTLSIIASENAAARSTSKTPEPPASGSDNTDSAPVGRDAIAQSLASRDPAFFRQSAEGGRATAAFRKNQVEDSDTIESHNSGPRMQLPGMSASSKLDLGEILAAGESRNKVEERPASTVSRASTASAYSMNTDINRNSMASPIPIKREHHLPPPVAMSSRDRSREREVSDEGGLAMSPSQRGISPERLARERPLSASPTKGMGGFVQSAMMKRSDSVNKRWSVQSPAGSVRSSALAGNRQSADHGSPFSSNRDTRSNSILSRDATVTTTSRPPSSHSNATLTRDSDLSSFNGSYHGKNNNLQTLTDDVYQRPGLPSSKTTGAIGTGAVDVRSKSTESSRSRPQSRSGDIAMPPPLSPSKTGGRWSPTKSSWLESALNKPDSPKPSKPAPLQPSWMAEINKAKEAKASAGVGGYGEVERSPSPDKKEHKHIVSIEGLKRAPGMGMSSHKSQGSIQDIAKKFGASPSLTSSATMPSFKKFEEKSVPSPKPLVKSDRKPSYEVKRVGTTQPVMDKLKTPLQTPTEEKEEPKFDAKPATKPEPEVKKTSEEAPLARSRTGTLRSKFDAPSTLDKPKPADPPKFDFRGNLKPKVPPPSTSKSDEPEFKNVFGQLRRTKTQNYKAPDELKDNILRGKAGLVDKGGPVKSVIKDEFKDSILKKKDDFKKAVEDGTAVALTKKVSHIKTEDEIPEAIAKVKQLGRSGTIIGVKKVDIPPPGPKPLPGMTGNMPVRERAKSITAKHAEAQIVEIRKQSRTPSPAEEKKVEEKKSEPASDLPFRQRAKSIVDRQEAFSKPTVLTASSTPAIASAAERLKKWEKPQPVEKKEQEFPPPLRSKTDDPGTLRNRFENKFAAPTPKLESETSAPGRLQLQGKLAGNKLAERFNPALAGLLARGPPAAGGDSGSSVKTTSTSSAKQDDGEPKEGPQLTHMTKSRARGPKRKAPKTVTAAIPAVAEACATTPPVTKPKVIEVEKKVAVPPVAEKPRSETVVQRAPSPTMVRAVSPVQARKLPTPPVVQKSSFEKFESAQAKTQPIPQKSTLEPFQPSKPTELAREASNTVVRSRPRSIITDAPVEEFKSNRPLSNISRRSGLPHSPIKSGSDFNFTSPPRTGMSDRDSLPSQRNSIPASIKSVNSERKVTPTLKPKPEALSSPPVDKGRFDRPEPSRMTSRESVLSNGRSDGASLNKVLSNQSDAPSISSVKTTLSYFARTDAGNEHEQERQGAKSPIKLPTLADEKEREAKMGLFSPTDQSNYAGSSDARTPGDRATSPVMNRQMFASSRPLPVPPLRLSKSPRPEDQKAAPVPASPAKTTRPPSTILSPKSTETRSALSDFFTDLTPPPSKIEIDTTSLILNKPDFSARITTLSSSIYRITNECTKEPVPRGLERVLFENEMYIGIHIYTTAMGRRLTECYFWIGDSVPAARVHDAEILATKEARSAGGKLVVLRQGLESAEFIDSLGGILITHRDSSAEFGRKRNMMLCVRNWAGRIVVDEVDFLAKSLCSGYPFLVISASGETFLWKGRGSSVEELSSARLVGMEYTTSGEMVEITDGRESQTFLDVFGRGTVVWKSADHWRRKPNYKGYTARLFRADYEAGGGKMGGRGREGNKVRDTMSSSFSLSSFSFSPSLPGTPRDSLAAPSAPVTPTPKRSWSPMALWRASTPTSPAPAVVTPTAANIPSSQIVEISPFAQSSLSPSSIYILDAFFELYIIVGHQSSNSYQDFCTALVFAQEYGILAAGMEDRPFVPVSTVVLEGVPRDLRGVFRKWVDGPTEAQRLLELERERRMSVNAGGGLKRGKSLKVLSLTNALDAVRL